MRPTFLMLLRLLAATAVSIVLVPAVATAQQVRLIGDFRDWSAYSALDGVGNICFALAKPVEVVPQPDGFTAAYIYLTHRPAESVSNEINLVAGFAFAPDTPATLTVSGETFDLFTESDAAWLLDPARADGLASAMRAGTTLVMEGTSDKGIKIRETFSLSGATAASRAIDGEC
jgi:hypothetical protein